LAETPSIGVIIQFKFVLGCDEFHKFTFLSILAFPEFIANPVSFRLNEFEYNLMFLNAVFDQENVEL